MKLFVNFSKYFLVLTGIFFLTFFSPMALLFFSKAKKKSALECLINLICFTPCKFLLYVTKAKLLIFRALPLLFIIFVVKLCLKGQ